MIHPRDKQAISDRTQTLVTLVVVAAMSLALGLSLLKRTERFDQHAASQPIIFRIDPNHADVSTLALLPSVGPGIAQRIVNDRNANGPFTSAADLQRVKGVGEKTRQAVEPWIALDAPLTDRR